jgi:proteic killer suppression protein
MLASDVTMIRSFKGRYARAIFEQRDLGKGFPADLIRVARRKLVMVNQARTLEDLRSPPQNRLEALTKDRRGQHSIRINDQFRVCFVWTGSDAENVEITDYH